VNDDVLSSDQKEFFEEICELWNLYIVTQGGDIRRVSMPGGLWAYSVWLMRENTDVSPEYFDKQACELASRENCGYAEAMREFVDRTFNRDAVCEAFLEDSRESSRRSEIASAFSKEQRRRERLWREAHNEWRKDLPPCLD
jgi:hypothetical protein